ncbi:hypothetical protein D4768_09770 [Rhodococcus erythropolis]|nr:hypothetical protein D4768_09770 [Rhodococcus erythropolis]
MKTRRGRARQRLHKIETHHSGASLFVDGCLPFLQASHTETHGRCQVSRGSSFVKSQLARAIIEHAADANALDVQVDGEWGVGARDELADPYVGDLILRALAAVYSDHRDYDPSWAL